MGNIVATSGACAYKAGANVSGSIPEAAWVTWISGAEAIINSETKYNWSDAYAALDADVKYILDDAVTSIVAINAINYDMSGYTSRSEAQTMIDVNNDRANKSINELKDIKVRDFVVGA